MTSKEIAIGLLSPLIVGGVVWLAALAYDANTIDSEMSPVADQVAELRKEVNVRVQQEARRELRVLSKAILAAEGDETLPPERRDELVRLYETQLDEAQATLDAYED